MAITWSLAAAAAAANDSGAHEEWCGVAIEWICRSIVMKPWLDYDKAAYKMDLPGMITLKSQRHIVDREK
jgi:hypothetical protein